MRLAMPRAGCSVELPVQLVVLLTARLGQDSLTWYLGHSSHFAPHQLSGAACPAGTGGFRHELAQGQDSLTWYLGLTGSRLTMRSTRARYHCLSSWNWAMHREPVCSAGPAPFVVVGGRDCSCSRRKARRGSLAICRGQTGGGQPLGVSPVSED